MLIPYLRPEGCVSREVDLLRFREEAIGDDVASSRMRGPEVMARMKDLAITEENKEKSVRGKRARNSGNAFEREIVAAFGNGARRVGQFGGKTDVEVPGWLAIQAKCGNGFFPTRLDNALRSLSVRGDELKAVVVGNKPGMGVKRTSLIVFDLQDFLSYYNHRTEDATSEDA
jgi:hypothetical protein